MNAWLIEDDAKLSIGEAQIVREGIRLYLSDPYSNYSFIMDPDSKVELVPIPPIYRLGRLSNYVYVNIITPVVGIGGKSYWLTLPYEIAVVVDGRVVAILTPTRIKYTLYGSIVEGTICRYHESRVYREYGEVSEPLGMLLVTLPLSREANLYSFAIINAQSIRLYRLEKKRAVYYEVVRLSSNPLRPIAEPLGKPPVGGLKEVEVPKDLEGMVGGVNYGYYGPD